MAHLVPLPVEGHFGQLEIVVIIIFDAVTGRIREAGEAMERVVSVLVDGAFLFSIFRIRARKVSQSDSKCASSGGWRVWKTASGV